MGLRQQYTSSGELENPQALLLVAVGVGVPCLTFGRPAPYSHRVCADHVQLPIPVPNLGRARLAGPPVPCYPPLQLLSSEAGPRHNSAYFMASQFYASCGGEFDLDNVAVM